MESRNYILNSNLRKKALMLFFLVPYISVVATGCKSDIPKTAETTSTYVQEQAIEEKVKPLYGSTIEEHTNSCIDRFSESSINEDRSLYDEGIECMLSFEKSYSTHEQAGYFLNKMNTWKSTAELKLGKQIN